jgi:hypothetical protein
LACGSASTNSVLNSKTPKQALKLIAVVVFPTPPFWLAMAIILPMSPFLLSSDDAPFPVDNASDYGGSCALKSIDLSIE